MIVRYALVGLAVAGLSRPAAAIETISDSIQAQKEADLAKVFAQDGATAQKLASLIPPKRPDELTGPEAQPAHAASMQGSAPLVPTGFVSVEPPRRDAEFGPAVAAVSVVPPFRPAFPGDKSSVAIAAIQADAVPASLEEIQASPARFREILPPARPSFSWDAEPAAPVAAEAAPPVQVSPPAPQPSLFSSLFGSFPSAQAPAAMVVRSGHNGIDALIATHAKLNGLPEDLVHRVVIRESKYNPRAVGRGGALGLMQIKHATARSLGYGGSSSGLLDAETNLTYGVKYLAGAYQAAGGDHRRAVAYYARGYYYAAKSQGLTRMASRRGLRQEAEARAEDGAVLAQTSTR